jgi:hypothetical protein
MIWAGAFAAGATALAACGGHGVVPTSSADSSAFGSASSPLKASTCATSPPQYGWIFKGSCDEFKLTSKGGSFSLAAYSNITVTGSIGKNTAKGTVTVALADAVDKKGDIEKYKSESFPPYKAKGTTVVYAAANNQGTQTIKPVAVKGKTVLQYVISDTKGLPGTTCGAALLTQGNKGSLVWDAFPGTGHVSGKSVTISVYEAPSGFELPPKGSPLYFAINCYK